jgi:uncharacterized protein YbjT (DUF2867 family)
MQDTRPAPRTALLAGATGLVGRELLAQLLQDDLYSEVHVLSRRPLEAAPLGNGKLHVLVGPLADTPVVPRVSDVYIALGTTIKVAGSQQAFRAIDHDLVLHVARLARQAGAQRLAVVSALGADANSRVFYNRVKGETENDLRALGYASLAIVRPSLLSGDRASLKQADRPGEGWALKLLMPVQRWLPASVRPVPAAAVATAMRASLRDGSAGTSVVESRQLHSMR